MTSDAGPEKLGPVLARLTSVSLVFLFLSGCARNAAPTPLAQRTIPPPPIIDVHRTGDGFFLRRGTNVFFSTGVNVVIVPPRG